MAVWGGESVSTLWGRDNVPGHGMEMVQHGIDLPSYEMSHDAMNHTIAMLNNLPLFEVQTMRYIHIGFGCWSCALALILILRIWYDSWRAHQLEGKQHPRPLAFFYNLHLAEIFPLILGFIILAQSLSMVLIQSMALQTAFVTMCKTSATFVFTLIFAIGWFHMVFGLDMTIRALKPPMLTVVRRKRRTTLGLIGLSLALTLATWLSTRIRPAGDSCFGDIIFRTIRSSLLGIVFCTIMIPSFIIMALIIGVRLRKTVLMDPNERIAGTRMVWYLGEAAVIYTLILPFWIQAMTGTFDANFTASRLAEIVLFSSGSIICITHFVLRSNAARMAIKPNRTPWMTKKKYRFFGPSDLEIINISPPILNNSVELEPEDKWRTRNSGGRLLNSPTESSPDSSVVGSTIAESSVGSSSPPKPAPALYRRNWPLLDDMERPPTPAKPTTPRGDSLPSASRHRKQPSYSLFPTEDDSKMPGTALSVPSNTPLSTVAATRPPIPSLLPPFRPFAFDGSRESTATLEIGMRFSSAPAAAAAVSRPSTPPTKTKRLTLMTAIDDMLRDTTAAQNSSSRSQDNSPHPVQKSKSPFAAPPSSDASSATMVSASNSVGNSRARNADGTTQAGDYTWLDLPELRQENAAQQRPASKALSAANSVTTHAKRISSVYLSRSESLRRQAENNRLELANLERSGSGATRTKLRPAYPNPTTPDGSVVGER